MIFLYTKQWILIIYISYWSRYSEIALEPQAMLKSQGVTLSFQSTGIIWEKEEITWIFFFCFPRFKPLFTIPFWVDLVIHVW